jgi:hypothetical protein
MPKASQKKKVAQSKQPERKRGKNPQAWLLHFIHPCTPFAFSQREKYIPKEETKKSSGNWRSSCPRAD